MTTLTPAEVAAQVVVAIRDVQARCHRRGDTDPAEAPEPERLSDWSSDRACEKWENETTRSWT